MLYLIHNWSRNYGDRVEIPCPLEGCHEKPWIYRSALDRNGCGLIDCPKHRLVAVRLAGAETLLDLLAPKAAGPAV